MKTYLEKQLEIYAEYNQGLISYEQYNKAISDLKMIIEIDKVHN